MRPARVLRSFAFSLLFSCTTQAPSADPTDAAGALSRCGALAPELAITCRVEAAARAGREGTPAVVEQACGGLEGRWA